jgi:hypothetical protein
VEVDGGYAVADMSGCLEDGSITAIHLEDNTFAFVTLYFCNDGTIYSFEIFFKLIIDS